MKFRATPLTEGSRNSHSHTMAVAARVISESHLDKLNRIRTDLERGIRQHTLNLHDAQHLLCKVQLEIARRHFQ